MASIDLINQFKEVQQYFNEQQNQGNSIPEAYRTRIYGLQKQSIEGDCKLPCPPSSNAILRAKWDAWMECKSLSQHDAMTEYITLVVKSFPKYKPSKEVLNTITGSSPSRSQTTASVKFSQSPATTSTTAIKPVTTSVTISKEGVLYKQRDVFKGWRPRRFTLQDSLLHYYLENSDEASVPRKTMELCGCSVIDVKPTKVGDVDYYPFVISHPSSALTYNLASTSKEETNDWVSKIREASLLQRSETPKSTIVDRLLERKVREGDIDGQSTLPFLNPDSTVKNIPEKLKWKVEAAIQSLFNAVYEEDNEWEVLFEKHSVLAKKKPNTGVITVKGESLVNYQIKDVFDAIINEDKFREIDEQIFSSKVLKTYSVNTFVVYRQSKHVWPISARDYTNLTHWRALNDGNIDDIFFCVLITSNCLYMYRKNCHYIIF